MRALIVLTLCTLAVLAAAVEDIPSPAVQAEADPAGAEAEPGKNRRGRLILTLLAKKAVLAKAPFLAASAVGKVKGALAASAVKAPVGLVGLGGLGGLGGLSGLRGVSGAYGLGSLGTVATAGGAGLTGGQYIYTHGGVHKPVYSPIYERPVVTVAKPIVVIAKPSHPVKPVDPWTPVDPVDPWTPVDPVDPWTPVDPVDPWAPVDPVDPWNPVKPVDPWETKVFG